MVNIAINQTFICTARTPFPIGSMYRVLWLSKPENIAVIIRIDQKKLGAPYIGTYSEIENWVEGGKLAPRVFRLQPQHRLTDEQLTERFPAKNRRVNPITKKKPEISAAVEYRNIWLPIIDQVIPQIESVWRKEKSLFSIISAVAKSHKVPVNETYQVLYRFWACGSARLSVIPNRFLCGGEGSRLGKGYRLGRKKTATKLKGLPNDNFILDEVWLQRIRDVHHETIKRGVSAASAYQTFLNLYCVSSCTFVKDTLDVTYFPKRKRPSKAQFISNGPGNNPEEETWRKQLSDKEYEKNYRGMYGNADAKTFSTGILADVDATSNDRYLVSVFSRLRGVGTARSLPVVDVNTGYIFGVYIGWRVNGEAAKLSILNAASDKVEFCLKYGIKISTKDWYSCLHAEYRADRGEFHSKVPRESLGGLNRSIEYVQTGRPDLRAQGEQAHRRLHDHDADGSTHGSLKQRGEKDPAKAALQNIFEYTRDLIREILWHNNFMPVPHLLTTEMRQCGVKPTRKAILEWSIEQGYHHQIAYDEDDLVLALCPEVPAVVTANGVYPIVRRNGETGDEIILNELRYLGSFVEEQRWLENARLNGRRRIVLRMNPNDPRKVWYHDIDTGLHTFTLATEDPLIARLATVHDLLVTKTDEISTLSDCYDEADVEKAKTKLLSVAERKEAAKEKREQQRLAKKANINSSTAVGRRQNRQDEVAVTGQSPIPIIPIIAPSIILRPDISETEPYQVKSAEECEELDDDSGMMKQWLEKDGL